MSEKRLVWDLPLRIFHWLLVLSMAASWYTAENSEEYLAIGRGYTYIEFHFWLGYWTLGMIAFRIIWGFVGPRHARFTSFIAGPRRFFAYVGGFFKRDSIASIGHNPMGALVVVLMLLMVGAQAVSGLFLIENTEIFQAPYHSSVDESTANRMMAFHAWNFDTLLWVIGLHVLAIFFYRVYKRQKLVGPMFTGRKPADLVPPHEAISSSQLWKALIVAVICAGGVYFMLEQAPPQVYTEY
jgi:cytochrome b